jgi:hypothetical protein
MVFEKSSASAEARWARCKPECPGLQAGLSMAWLAASNHAAKLPPECPDG